MTVSLLNFVAATLLLQTVVADYTWDQKSPLDDYVFSDDGYYSYTFLDSYDCGEYTLHLLNMTSQKWFDETVTTTPVWWHHMFIAIPKSPRKLDAFHLVIHDGERGDDYPVNCTDGDRAQYLGDFAVSTGAVAAIVRQVPFQPLFFTDTPNVPRTEDMIIARSWRYYIERVVDDPNVVLPVPMVKAAKLAVDTVIDYVKTVNPSIQLTKVMPTGRSKRGWTTWLLGAVDRRVFAMVPVVLTLGRWHPNLHHHYRSYGAWSWAMTPYYNENITQYIDHPRTYEAFDDIGIDYMTYNPRLTMPKFIIHGSGDEFFLNDDPWYFFTELREPKHILILENASHDLYPNQPKVDRMNINFFEASLNSSYVWPRLAWTRSETADGGAIGVATSQVPTSITAWWAETTNRTCDADTGICRRDFRFSTVVPPGPNPVTWVETAVEGSNGNYRVTIPKRGDNGFRAFFLALTFPGSRPGDVFHFTTEVNVIPDILPYPTCTTPEECTGTIV